MILAAAVCPHPPLLAYDVPPGSVDDLATLRVACDAAVRTLLDADPSRVIVIGAGDRDDDRDESAGGSLAAYGLDISAGGPDHGLPLSLTIGAWLLDRAGWTGARTYSSAHPDVDGDVALLVMADGAAKRSIQAPGFLDERAEPYDASIAAALAGGDPEALAQLDADLGVELGSAGAVTLRTLGDLAKGADITARLRYDEAPFGVGYFVADWTL